jgi:hypothetical protein
MANLRLFLLERAPGTLVFHVCLKICFAIERPLPIEPTGPKMILRRWRADQNARPPSGAVQWQTPRSLTKKFRSFAKYWLERALV